MIRKNDPLREPETVIHVPNMSPEERHKILVEWNQTKRDYPRDRCLHQLFEEQVQRTPHVIAVEFEGQALTYVELNARANQLANYLCSQGVGPEMLVGVYAVRSLEMLVSLFGILKAGGAYVPIDPEYPSERVSYMLSDSGVAVLLTQNHLVASLPNHSTTVFCLDTDWKQISSRTDVNPDTEVTPSNLAYMIYTSGSTGKPKGALNTHGGIVNQLFWIQEQYQLRPSDVVLQKTPFSFDVSVWEFFWPLLSGARLCIAMPGGHRDADYLVHAIQAHRVTVSVFVPSMLQLFLEHGGVERCTSLRHVICIGEALPADLRDRFFARLDVPLHNLYGPAEAAVSVTHWTCQRDQNLPFVPIGRPVANTQCYILDSNLEPVPIGISGELYLGGLQIGRGYHNQPELTAQKFIPDPFQSDPDARLYKTGDFCRLLDDGNIQFLGRIDNQVKIRGFRIELDEIESILFSHPDVSHCVVSTDENEHGEKSLVAYIVSAEQSVLAVGSLRKWLAERLPEYMIPSRFFSIAAIPLSPNGKVDRHSLKTLSSVEFEAGTEYRPPRTTLEQVLADAWKIVLGIERISVTDNVFELGAHSLLAMRIVSLVGKQLNCNLPVKWVFENPTVEQLAQKLIENKNDDVQLLSIPLIDRRQPIPLSFGQHAMWLVQALLPDSAMYNQPIAIHLKGRIDRILVNQCIEQIARRHESLRTAFIQTGETLVQHICGPTEFEVNCREISLRQPATDQRQQALQAALIEEARRPFDLTMPPLWRVLWIDLAHDELMLELTFHHSIIDEWSVQTFCRELSALYRTVNDPQAASLPELPIQYADYAVWQRARQSSAEWEQSIVYWKAQLADLPPALELPSDRVRPIQPSGQGAIREFRLSAPLTSQLRQLARDETATLFTLMFAAFNVWLARRTGQTDLIVGTPVADRDRPEVQSQMGYFLNTLPIRTKLEGNLKFRQILRRIHQTLMDAYSHAEIPFERLVELAVKEREPGRHPIYQVMFVLIEESVGELQLGDATGHLVLTSTRTSKNDLTLDIQATGDEWTCRMEYATDLFTPPLIEQFAANFQTLLEEIATSNEASIQQNPLLTEIETQQILKDWNQTSIDFPEIKTIHEFFENQVKLTPENDAIVFNDSRMSYRQLNDRANALASRLITLGAKPDSLIGLFGVRSIETIVGLLGILKAGAAYVPLDPAYPEARLQSIIQDARIKVIVTHKHLDDRITEANVDRVVLDASDPDELSAGENPHRTTSPTHLAYVLFTSGSTGRPKGVAMEHRALTNLIQWQIQQSTSHEQFKTLQFASLGFDVSFQEIFSTWCSGGTLVLIDEDTRRDMPLLIKYIERNKLERIFVPFVVLQQFIEANEAYLQKTLPLREIVTAGEQLRITPQLVRFFENNPGCRLVNQYGPTEAHVVTSYSLEGSPSDWPLLPPIGRPIANIQVYVLDAHLQPLPVGMPGELYLGGVGLARGYLNQPELTAEKFLPDPFSNQAGSRLYRTGDKVRWNVEGQLEFLGRIDQQIKFRGFRIELGEIEAVLNHAPQVAQAVVMLREDHPSEKRLVAYVVPTDPTEIPSTENLQEFLQNQLPEYMVPSIFVVLPDLPLTVNGKVDRKALPFPNYELFSSGKHRPIAPRTPLEQILAEAWKTVLGIERVSVNDNFFELGGHSLLAMRLMSIIGRQINREVLVKWVFENPTIQLLAQKLMGLTGDNPQRQPIPLVDRSQRLPLSFGQHAMWLVQALLPDSATYNQPIAIRVTGQIDRTLVDRSIEQIAWRHESLRTAFIQSGESAVQQICEPAEFAVNRREISLRHEPIETKHQVLQAAILDEVRRPFDLAVAPLWRVLWIELSDDNQVLVLTFHHSIIDEWSTQIFCRELSALYRTDGAFQAAALPELPIQYADYAMWQRARQVTAAWAQSLAYWKAQLADLPSALELPSDRVRPIQPSGQGAIHEFRLSASLTSQLRQLARAESTTRFTLMLAAFHVWLARHTGQTDLIVGTPLANRERPEVQSLIGYFLNTLPIRVRLDENVDFREVLRQIHQTFWDAYKHAEIPFEQMVELAVKEREPGRNPIFQVMFVLLEESVGDLPIGTSTGMYLDVQTRTSKNDLTLDIRATGDEWVCRLEYPTDLFSTHCVELFSVHFVELLNSITKSPDSQIGRLNILNGDEKQQIIDDWNPLQSFSTAKHSIHQLFEEQVQRTPNAIAVSYDGQSLSYSRLNSLANCLARQLVEHQIESESRVGICLERSLDMVVGILAVLKAGAAYVPLDSRYPRDRLAYILQDAETKVLICDSTTTPLFDNSSLPLSIIYPSQDASEIEFTSAEVSSENAAYVIYTSGSTGQPKGCVVTHGNVVRLFQSTESLFGFNQTDIWTLFHSFAFDFSVWEIWGALFYGGRLVIVPFEVSRSPDEFLDLLIDEGVTVLNQTPSAFRHLIEVENSRSERSNSLRLRYVIFGGEGLDPRSLRTWVERHGIDHPQLINMYGITETTVHVTYQRLTSSDIARGGSPIGRPLADLQVYLLNTLGQLVPLGVPGEIYVGGAGLARGYLHRPELTAARFVKPPFDECPADRLYRSGDLAKRNKDGSLEFLGRIDNQVKIRGHRIELGEIEAAILQIESVAQAAVIARDDGPGGKILAAYLVPQLGAGLDAAVLRQSLATRLPSYMIPSFFVELEMLPLTINGKLDAKALPLPQSPSIDREQSIVHPRNPIEKMIASAWRAVLNVQTISVDDNFFELGGHSLLAMRVVSMIGSTLGRGILVRWVFEYPTIEALAKKIESEDHELAKSGRIEQVDRDRPLPMSPGQQAMWLLQQLLPDSATYNLSSAWRIGGPLNRGSVQRSLQVIVDRHEALRTALVMRGGELVQQIIGPNDLVLPWAEKTLFDIPVEQQDVALEALMAAEAHRPFDLARAPLWRLLFIDLADDEQVLLFTFHHSIFDEWSLRLFKQEFVALYASDGDLQRTDLPTLPVQYADYASWQRQKLTGENRERLVAFWRKELADLPPALELPSDRIRPSTPTSNGAIHEFHLDQFIVTGLRQLAREERMTLFTVLLTGFEVWLYRQTGQTDIIVGTPLADRERPELQSLIGYFLNMLPIRSQLEPESSFRQVLQQVHQTIWNAFSYADLPFEQMVELAVKERELGRHPVYQVMFVLLEESLGDLRLGSSIGTPFDVRTSTSKNDLTFTVQATGDEWVCQLEYAADLFNDEAVARMADQITQLLRSISKEASKPIGQLNLIGEDERHKILVQWNQTRRDYPQDKCLHQLFEEQVQRTPDAIAVEFEGESLTYSVLNTRANQLAHYLRSHGVRPDMLVGVYAQRSLEMVVSLYGILKAGGAYVPIDPEYPAERVSYMIADSGVTVLLTQSHLVSSLPAHSLTVLCLDTDWKNPSSLAEVNLDTEVTPSDLAYMIYTSGSTGKPKGALNTHLGIVNQIYWIQDQYQLGPTDVVLQKTPFSFDVSVWEFFWPLLNGARLCVAKPGGHRDADYLVDVIQAHQVTVVDFVPSMLQLFLEHSEVERCTSLRHVICIGEALPADLRDRFFARIDAPLHNLYGPAEAAVSVTHWTCLRDETLPYVPIGRPVANTQCYILDAHLAPVPIGVSGELYLGGVQIGRGYHNQPELTAQKFISDPFQTDPEARLYKTGDLCRLLSDGNIHFLGRIDNQVKIRGFRIELDEIESVLTSNPDVSHCVVSADENERGEKTLAAYVVPTDNSVLSVALLRKWLVERLPDYMIPSRFFSIAAIPLSPNGKVDRRALKKSGAMEFESETKYRPPRTNVELELTKIWQKLLGREQIGIFDNFFELGGHSLLAVRVVDAMRSSMGVTIKIADLFRHATVAELAESLSNPTPTSKVSNRGQYLESIRPGSARTHLVIVGAKLRVPLELLPPEVPVWWLKLDGLHVWPPKHLDLNSQAAIHAQELFHEIASGTILLCGHSYGGSVAIGIAQQLMRIEKHDVKLILLEPPLWSTRQEPIIKKVTRKLKEFKDRDHSQNVREVTQAFYKSTIGRVKNLIIGKRRPSDQEIAIDDRWVYMEPYFQQNAGAFQLPRKLDVEVHLIKTRNYDQESFERLKQCAKHSLLIHATPENLDHYEMADPQNSMIWMAIVLKLIDHDETH